MGVDPAHQQKKTKQQKQGKLAGEFQRWELMIVLLALPLLRVCGERRSERRKGLRGTSVVGRRDACVHTVAWVFSLPYPYRWLASPRLVLFIPSPV